MTKVQLKVGVLIEDTNHAAGDTVEVTDEKAHELVKSGAAERPEDAGPAGEIANPGRNPFADAISPEPPGGPVLNPVDGLSLNVQDNPGLTKLAEVANAKARPSKAGGGKPGKINADTTADELVPGDRPKVEAAKVEPPKVEAAKVEPPKVEAVKVEAVKVEAAPAPTQKAE